LIEQIVQTISQVWIWRAVVLKSQKLTIFRTSSTLIAAADTLGHPGVGVLLESCLADKLAFGERTRRLVRALIAEKVSHA